MSPYDVYERYLALKQHFTNPDYNYFLYSGRVRASKESFNKRKDRYFFEKLSRKKTDSEIIDYFVSNFIESSDPSKMWIGELKTKGDEIYFKWKSRTQSLSYVFNQDLKKLTENHHLFEAIVSKTGHPRIIKSYMAGKISIETLVIIDKLTNFTSKLSSYDPVLSVIVGKIKKYEPFLKFNRVDYENQIRQILMIK